MWIITVFLLLLQQHFILSNSERIISHTFEAPYTEIDGAGHRLVSRKWRGSGSTTVNNNFIRLTPDQQSKKGAMWSRETLDVPSFSAILKFRISGKGKDYYGDGLAVWLVQQGYYMEGELHGFQEDFIGIGIIFDTFQNTENINAHRDVTVLINNGEKTLAMMTEVVQGCNVHVRYHTDRADFRVTDASQAKIIVNDRNLTILVDAKNTGDWQTCVKLTDIDLPSGWATDSYIGLSASTGQLSDNHDVLALITYKDEETMERLEAAKKLVSESIAFPSLPDMTSEDRVQRLETTLNTILNKLDFMDHHFEHHFVTNEDNIDHVKAKLDKREDQSEERIEELEALIKKEVAVHMTDKITTIQNDLHSKMDHKILKYETKIDKRTRFERQIKERENKSGGGSWKIPFFILFMMLIGIVGAVYYFYLKLLKKTHLP